MATGIIRNFPIPAPPSTYFPLIFQQCPYGQDKDRMQEDKPEVRDGEEYEEEEEEDCDIQEEEEEECNKEAFALDVTKQLLRFADLISRDVQRYFGRSSGEEACDIYNHPVSVTTSGRLRYYDDLLKIARAGSPEEREHAAPCGEDRGGSGLGPLAELFQVGGPAQAHNRPMIKRHLPLSFWSEPSPRCPAGGAPHATNAADTTHATHATGDGGQTLPQHDTNCLESSQPDFSDLLAFWEPNPELTHTLTDNTHVH